MSINATLYSDLSPSFWACRMRRADKRLSTRFDSILGNGAIGQMRRNPFLSAIIRSKKLPRGEGSSSGGGTIR